jgi:hypothetical protein
MPECLVFIVKMAPVSYYSQHGIKVLGFDLAATLFSDALPSEDRSLLSGAASIFFCHSCRRHHPFFSSGLHLQLLLFLSGALYRMAPTDLLCPVTWCSSDSKLEPLILFCHKSCTVLRSSCSALGADLRGTVHVSGHGTAAGSSHLLIFCSQHVRAPAHALHLQAAIVPHQSIVFMWLCFLVLWKTMDAAGLFSCSYAGCCG